ncbi:MAG: ribosome biogenesis GTPase Der [bacterium]
MKTPIVAIVGRPNVGKSSLFNRFLRRRLAVVAEQSGVTRDRNYAVCDWNGVDFQLVDTGGIVPQTKDQMEQLIMDQAEFAVAEADLVLFVGDVRVGVNPGDIKIARYLRKADLTVVLAVNKVDHEKLQPEVYEFMKLGLGEPMPVSATTGHGVGDLLDEIVKNLPVRDDDDKDDDDAIRVALVGRPNVGKSSFINRLTGQLRSIVSEVAGTTRDAIDTPFEMDGKRYVMVDTAGLRRKYKVHENIEFFTNLRASRAIDRSDAVIILIDAVDGVTAQDQHILELVSQMRRPAILAVNKWDLMEKDSFTADRYSLEIKDVVARYSYLPIIYVSALTGQRVTKAMQLVSQAYVEGCRRIVTSELNEFLKKVTERRHAPARKGKHIKFYYVTQSEVSPPTFVFFVNFPKLVDKAYISYLSNQIRAEYGFAGVPIRIKFRGK